MTLLRAASSLRRPLLIFLALLLAETALGPGCGPPRPRIHLLLDEIDGLEEKDPVVYRDLVVGEVVSVTLRPHPDRPGGAIYAELALDPQHLPLLAHEQHWVVEGRRYMGLSSNRQVRIHDRDVPLPTPVRPEDIVVGTSFAEHLLEDLGDGASSALRDAVKAAREHARRLLEHPPKP